MKEKSCGPLDRRRNQRNEYQLTSTTSNQKPAPPRCPRFSETAVCQLAKPLSRFCEMRTRCGSSGKLRCKSLKFAFKRRHSASHRQFRSLGAFVGMYHRKWLAAARGRRARLQKIEGKPSMKRTGTRISRRSFLTVTAGALAAPTVLRPFPAAAESKTLTVTGWGGSYQEILDRHIFKPFTADTGIAVNVVPVPDLSKVKAQQLVGNVEWDVLPKRRIKRTFGLEARFLGET
ncbi:hypothetical protein ACVWYH_005339 [Bradyrhizobium sp. GM24.11]